MLPTPAVRFLVLALGVLCAPAAAPSLLHAQAAREQEDARAWLGSARLLLIRTASGEEVRGQPIGWVDDWILLRDGRRIAFGEILRAEALRARTGEGARWGGLVGAVAGAGLLVASSGDEGASAAEGVLYVSGGALAGAAVGALWGSRQYSRELIYSAPTANVQAPQTGLTEYRLGGGPGAVRTNLAITPFVGVGTYGNRTGTSDGDYEVGLASSREVGLQVQYAMGPRSVVRLAGSAIHASAADESDGTRVVFPGGLWLARAELGLELRVRSNVPGYLVVAADGLYNPHGYVPGSGSSRLRPDGVDAGVMPRLGVGLGFDFFMDGDRRVRLEWIYRVGRYHAPAVESRGYEPTRVTRDATFTLGFHVPLVRPSPAR